LFFKAVSPTYFAGHGAINMDVVIHCDQCQTALRLSSELAGHEARCPSCQANITVPSLQDMLEETITGWIVHDVEETFQDRVRVTDERVAEERPSDPAAHRPVRSEPRSDDDDDIEVDPPTKRLWKMKPQPTEPLEYTLPEKEPGRAKQPPAATTVAEAKSSGYPTNLRVKDPIPHLVIHRINTAGVRFAFDSVWLKEPRFRASMPMRCVICGETDRSQLIARPLIFVDRLLKGPDKIDTIIAAHTVRKLADKLPYQIVHAMGRMEMLPEPFSFVMPYYVATRFARHALHAQTHDRRSGAITCDLLIPDPQTALDWLVRVNGVCGPEYERLEKDVALLHGSAWQQLDDECRHRLSGWCKLDPGETFRRYFNDVDFAAKDAGMAGLVVTDLRLLFKKHHRKGRVYLSRGDASIIATCDGKLVHLSIQYKGDRSRMLSIKLADVDELSDFLEDEPLQLVVT